MGGGASGYSDNRKLIVPSTGTGDGTGGMNKADTITCVILNTILINKNALRALMKFLRKSKVSNAVIDLYVALENTGTGNIEDSSLETDFICKSREIKKQFQGVCKDLPEQPGAHLRKIIEKIDTFQGPEEARAMLFECRLSVVHEIEKLLTRFERSKIFAEYQSYSWKRLSGKVTKQMDWTLKPLSRLLLSKKRRRKKSFTSFADDNSTNNALGNEDLLIMEGVSLLAKILKRSLQPYFHHITLVVSRAEALEQLAARHFHVILLNLDAEDNCAINVIQSYRGMDTYVNCIRRSNSEKAVLSSSERIIKPAIVLGMTIDPESPAARKAHCEGFTAVLPLPFTVESFLCASGDVHYRYGGMLEVLDSISSAVEEHF